MFTARRYDIEILRSGSGRTGLYYYRARYYNPYIGRFLQLDPAYQGMNWYAYSGNNSINCVDPMGLYIVTVDIPLQTVWHCAGSGKYDTYDAHYVEVSSFLNESNFFIEYPDVELLNDANYPIYTGTQYGGTYHCRFEVPDSYKKMKMNIDRVTGIPILIVTTGRWYNSKKTQFWDWRLIGILSNPTYKQAYIAPVGKFWGWSFSLSALSDGILIGLAIKNFGVAHSLLAASVSVSLVGAVAVTLWTIYSFWKLCKNPSKAVPNFATIKNYMDFVDVANRYYDYKATNNL